MPFFEVTFLFGFLPVTLVIYYALPSRIRNAWLFVASGVFYAFSSWAFLPILMFSIVVDYVVGQRIHRSESATARRVWLGCSLVTNLGLLGYFKYAGFVTSNLRAAGLTNVPLLEAALPVGISFYTFQSMSYSIDLYRGVVRPARSFASFGAFVSLFPQLVAGPIVRFRELEGQLEERTHSFDRFAQGIQFFVWGLAKKLLVADTAASLCDPIFRAGATGSAEAWAAVFLYAVQIYFDFSGYSDMAIGLGKMLGFELPQNFASPYKAVSLSDFWRRWHITLSTWLRDNLYIPLGGNRRGKTRTFVNLMLTMLLGGLWHGASWNFIIWGAIHGGALALERALRSRTTWSPPMVMRRGAVFLVVLVAWVFFRIETLEDATRWLAAMAFVDGIGAWPTAATLLAIAGSAVLIWIPPNTHQRTLESTPRRLAEVLLLFVVSLVVGYGRGTSPFLYFRF
ncbi:MAG: MBOAT family O-acyltransferase [Deltaproteobacteria bacterium]